MAKSKDVDQKNLPAPRTVWLAAETRTAWRARREALGISQRELGRRVGVSSGTVSNVETGKQDTLERPVYAKWHHILFREAAAIPEELWSQLVDAFSDVDEEEARKLLALAPIIKKPR